MASSPITSWKIHGEIMETATDFIFLGSKITVDGDCSHDIKRCLLLGRKVMKNLDSILKAETLLCQQTSIYSQRYGFSSSHVGIWELGHKEGWALKNWCFQTVVLEKLVSPFDSKEFKLVNSKGNQPWIFLDRTDAEAEVRILWLPYGKSQLIRKDPDAGKHCRQEEKGMTEVEIVGCHHWLNGHKFEHALGDGEG